MARTSVVAKILNAFGVQINPATEETLDKVQDNTLLDVYIRAGFQLDEGILSDNINGKNPKVKANANRQLVSEVFFGHPSEGAVYTHSTGDVQLKVNSTVDGDNKTVALIGWKDNGTPVVAVATLNGKTQVAVSDTMRYLNNVVNVSPDKTTGDVYASESTTIGGDGLPIDVTKIRGLMRQVRQLGFNPILMAEPNKKIIFYDLQGTTDATKDVQTGFEVKTVGTNYFKVIIENHIFQSSFNLLRHPAGVLQTGEVLQITAQTNTENASITQGFSFIEIDTTIII